MKSLKILFVAIILTCFVGVTQTMAQAYILRGTESGPTPPFEEKPLAFEIDGVEYTAIAETEFQLVGTPSLNLNWTSHGHIIAVFLDGVIVEDFKFKKAVKAYDTRGYDDKITITPGGKVNVTSHLKDFIGWW
jgi:hypothetical protein